MKFLASPLSAAVLALLLYLGTSAAILKKVEFKFPKKAGETAKALLVWDASTPELDQMVSELKKEKEGIDQRQKDLDDLEQRLAQKWREVNQATQMVSQLQKELEASLVRVREDEAQNLKKLAKVYSAMSPEGAAAIFKGMEDEQVVKVLVFMKDAESGPIMETFAKLGSEESKRAALISEKLRLATQRRAVGAAPTT